MLQIGNTSQLLDCSSLSAFNPEAAGGRLSLGAPSDLGQSLMPYLTVDMRAEEIQCDLWSVAEMAAKDERVKVLEEQLNERNKHIDELEKKFEATNKNMKESDKVRKLNFDNQILMG